MEKHFYNSMFIYLWMSLFVAVWSMQEIKAQDAKVIKPKYAVHQPRTRAVKIEFLAPLTNNVTIAYEQWMQNRLSLELKLGVIGIGFNRSEETKKNGAFIKLGVKMFTSKDYSIPEMRSVHPLQGFYFKPELIIGGYKHQEIVWFGSTGTWKDEWDFNIAVLFNAGKQWIINDLLTIDIAGGIGYGYSSGEQKTFERFGFITPYKYSHISGGLSIPVAYSGSFSIGIALK